MPEQKTSSEQKVETLDSSSPNSTNTHVVGSQCTSVSTEWLDENTYVVSRPIP